MLLGASKDMSDHQSSSPNFRPFKLQIPQANSVSYSTRTQTNKKAQDEILIHDTASAPLKRRDQLNPLISSPAGQSTNPLDSNNRRWPLSSTTQKGGAETAILKDLTSTDHQINTRQTIANSKSTPKAREIRPSLFEQNSVLIKNANKYLHANLEPNQSDWTTINANDNVDEEMEKVKMLDAWQFEMMKEKVSGTLSQETDIMNQYNRPKKQQQDNQGFPAVNTKLLHSIMMNPDEDRKYKKATTTMMSEPYSAQKSAKKHIDFSDGAMQSLENAIRENNQEILYDLISKKIKDFFFKTDIDQMTHEQLKLHTKMIAESVIDQFKSLKGATNLTLIQNRIEYIISRLRSTKNTQVDDMLGHARESMDRVKAKPVVDYRSIESMLIKNWEQSIQSIKDLREKLKNLNKQSFKINNQIKPVTKQLEQLNDKYIDPSNLSFIESKSGTSNNEKRVTLATPSEIGSPKSPKFDSSPEAASGANYIKLQKVKQERKRARLEVQIQLKELQKQLQTLIQDTDLSEKELKASRNYKIHYRIQLKDLYHKILKDESSLVDVNNTLSYTWIIRVLWRMNEEVKSHIFPSFLDQASINFIIDYSKIQDQLEAYCRQNGLLFLISNSEDFKDATVMYETFANFGNNHDENPSPSYPVAFGSTSGDLSAAINDVKDKDFNLLLDKFKNKMSTIKKVNLKAKKLTQTTYYNSKGKYVISKWEDVDPNKTSNTRADQSQDDIGTEFMDDRLSRNDLNISKNSHVALDRAIEILEKLKKMREEEIVRIIKQTLPKDFDEKLKLTLKKIFRFLFGRKEGEKGYNQCLKEKLSNDQKNLRHISGYHQKSNIENDTTTMQKFTGGMSYPVENQIWNSPKADALFSPSDYNFASTSAARLIPSSNLDTPASGDSVFKSAAVKLLGVSPV